VRIAGLVSAALLASTSLAAAQNCPATFSACPPIATQQVNLGGGGLVNQFGVPFIPPVAMPTAAGQVLTAFGGYLALSIPGTWPTSSAGMLPGALYAASTSAPAYIYAVAGLGPVVNPPIFYNKISAAALLAHGAVGLPQTDPHVTNQIWISGDILCVSQG
jgi:hypothetical protein